MNDRLDRKIYRSKSGVYLIVVDVYPDDDAMHFDLKDGLWGEFSRTAEENCIDRREQVVLGEYIDEEIECPACHGDWWAYSISGACWKCPLCENGYVTNPEWEQADEESEQRILTEANVSFCGDRDMRYWTPPEDIRNFSDPENIKRAELVLNTYDDYGNGWSYVWLKTRLVKGKKVLAEDTLGSVPSDAMDEIIREMRGNVLHTAGLNRRMTHEYMPGY